MNAACVRALSMRKCLPLTLESNLTHLSERSELRSRCLRKCRLSYKSVVWGHFCGVRSVRDQVDAYKKSSFPNPKAIPLDLHSIPKDERAAMEMRGKKFVKQPARSFELRPERAQPANKGHV